MVEESFRRITFYLFSFCALLISYILYNPTLDTTSKTYH